MSVPIQWVLPCLKSMYSTWLLWSLTSYEDRGMNDPPWCSHWYWYYPINDHCHSHYPYRTFIHLFKTLSEFYKLGSHPIYTECTTLIIITNICIIGVSGLYSVWITEYSHEMPPIAVTCEVPERQGPRRLGAGLQCQLCLRRLWQCCGERNGEDGPEASFGRCWRLGRDRWLDVGKSMFVFWGRNLPKNGHDVMMLRFCSE